MSSWHTGSTEHSLGASDPGLQLLPTSRPCSAAPCPPQPHPAGHTCERPSARPSHAPCGAPSVWGGDPHNACSPEGLPFTGLSHTEFAAGPSSEQAHLRLPPVSSLPVGRKRLGSALQALPAPCILRSPLSITLLLRFSDRPSLVFSELVSILLRLLVLYFLAQSQV